ncbi:MAG: CoB--CoM heterodisulfide reductase iron-sulfur subunit B family protein [candidate division KSB1 bacterium]|nr:CoB--CoM heterodisulfide reductase iron-sulfur subunit B family protein [candidate division KSB1 bacterium]MDZ7312660.1 CoB--CoM heterodisulfide reductase iron-sulfur subunit B family protein [candidate division KSB1 bacterium]
MKYPFYPGCSMHSSAKEYLASFQAISRYFGVELEEVKGWTCCAPTAVHGISPLLSTAIPASNLASIEADGKDCVMVPCAACYSRFKCAAHEIAKSKETAKKVNDCIGYEFKNSVKILHPLEIYNEIKHELVIKELSKINVVAYYGCLLTRPPEVKQFDDCENPQSMDNILRMIGLNVIDWSFKTDCCGATFNLTNKEVFMRLTGKILAEAKKAGADIIAVACPLCQVNLDSYQYEMKEPNIPVLYFSQLIGLAYGIDGKELGLDRHFVKCEEVIEECLKR